MEEVEIMPLLSVLTIVFIVLKLTGNIAWSWWWVLSPVWAPVAFGLLVIGVIAGCEVFSHPFLKK